jgi:DNA-binding XRE family transcriptional regulator
MTLRQLRHKRGLTQMQLAARSGVDQTTISALELEKYQAWPSWSIVGRLCKALRANPYQLFPVEMPQEKAS